MSCQNCKHKPISNPGANYTLRPKYRGRLFKNRQLLGAHLPFNQLRNSQKESERPAQDQQYEKVAISLRGDREPCQVGNKKTKKTKGKSSHPWRMSGCSSHDPPEMPRKRNRQPSHNKKTGYTQLKGDLAQPAFRRPHSGT